MYSVEKTAPVPSKGRGKVGPLKKLEKNPRFNKLFLQFGEEWILKSHVLEQFDEFTCLVYGQNRESSMDGLRTKPLRKIVGGDEKLTSKPKVDLARFTNPSWKKQIPTMMVKGGYRLRMECWNWCGPAMLRYQIHWLLSWILVIVKRKKRRRRKMRKGKDEFDFDDISW